VVTTEERLARLEGRVEEHTHMFTGLQETLSRFEARVDRRFEHMEGRLTALDQKIDQKSSALDQKLDQTRIGLETRIGAVDDRVGELHRKSDARFKWIAGLLGACLTSIIACLVGIVLAALP